MNCDHNSETCLKCVIEKAMEKQTKDLIAALVLIGREHRKKLKVIGIELSSGKERGLFWRFIYFFTGVS